MLEDLRKLGFENLTLKAQSNAQPSPLVNEARKSLISTASDPTISTMASSSNHHHRQLPIQPVKQPLLANPHNQNSQVVNSVGNQILNMLNSSRMNNLQQNGIQ